MSVTDRLRAFIEHPWFNTAIAVVIAINAVTLGLETSQTAMAVAGPVLTALDRIALWIFVAELLMKLFVYRLSFFKGGWNWFDFIIV